MKTIGNCIRAIFVGYVIDILGMLISSIILGLLSLGKVHFISVVDNNVFVCLGGYAAASVSRKYKLINSGIVGAIHIYWLYYISTSHVSKGLKVPFTISWLHILLILFALIGGLLSTKIKLKVNYNKAV